MKPMLLFDAKEERLSELFNDRWITQQKMDGERLIVQSHNDYMTLWNKQGALVGRKRVPGARQITLDGEQVGGVFYAFDLLELDGETLHDRPLWGRIALLEQYLRAHDTGIVMVPTSFTPSAEVLEQYRTDGHEGVVFKDRESRYHFGRRSRSWLKYKFTQTTEVIVTAIRVDGKANVLASYADGTIAGKVGVPEDVGVKIGDIIEVKYLYATTNRKLYQPIFQRVRHDCIAADCTWARLKYKGRVSPIR